MASSNPNSPRQKMINLMYLVFIAMLALNVSSEVLEGFELVEGSLLRSVKVSTQHNDRIFSDLKKYYETNPEKVEEWYLKGEKVKTRTDSLFNYIQELKVRIVKKADGKDGDPEHLKHPDDLNAAFDIMFEHGKNDAAKLKSDVDSYREYVASMVSNPSIKNVIESNLSTEPSEKAKANKKTWEESMFWQMPMAAAITLLTKLQNDIRSAEGEVLTDLIKNIDVFDFRVNKVAAYAIPESQVVMQGGAFRATIGLFAQDSTQTPRIYIGDKLLPEEANGKYVIGANTTGTFSLSGRIEMPRADGSGFTSHGFNTQYMVVKPSATIAPVLMNVLYAGIDNEISIAANGIASQNISPTMTNGSLTHKGNDIWVAKPTKVGTEAVITVMAKTSDGRSQEMGKSTFRVRALPPPTAYLTVNDQNGNPIKFEGGPLSKAALTTVNETRAAIDDGMLNIRFNVLRFELSYTDQMGITVREPSNGNQFSQRQKDMIRGFSRGKAIYIRGIVTRGPDGIDQTLKSPIEIIIN